MNGMKPAGVIKRSEKIRVSMDIYKIKAGVLEVAYLEYGSPDGWPCILMHGISL